jgi:hypothetical protein
MNILLLASHAVAEYDDIRMFTDLGHDVFCPGGYQNPRESGEGIRPAIPNAAYHPDLIEACEVQRRLYGDPGPDIDWAKARLHDDLIDWADVIIVHHFVDRWVARQWPRIKHKRVIWRTCGQSNPELERLMGFLRDDGLQIVRYSPAERRYFEPRGAFAGEDALIRFGKYPDDYGPWVGDNIVVGNITQHMAQRGDACGYGFWEAATEGLPVAPAGPGSEVLRGGIGQLSYDEMLDYLRHLRVYLYTGTRPASYTLGLIEAMLSGVPVVSIGAKAWGESWGGEDLFEAHEFANVWAPTIEATRTALRDLLRFDERAANASRATREMAIAYFGIDRIGKRWQDFLDGRELTPEPSPSHFPSQRPTEARP